MLRSEGAIARLSPEKIMRGGGRRENRKKEREEEGERIVAGMDNGNQREQNCALYTREI